MRLLVADGDPITRSLISAAFSSKFTISEAHDGAGAVRSITDAHEYGEPFTLVMLNMALSQFGDVDVLRFLKILEEPRTAVGGSPSKVILLTSSHGEDRTVDMGRLLEEVGRLTE